MKRFQVEGELEDAKRRLSFQEQSNQQLLEQIENIKRLFRDLKSSQVKLAESVAYNEEVLSEVVDFNRKLEARNKCVESMLTNADATVAELREKLLVNSEENRRTSTNNNVGQLLIVHPKFSVDKVNQLESKNESLVQEVNNQRKKAKVLSFFFSPYMLKIKYFNRNYVRLSNVSLLFVNVNDWLVKN